MKRHSSWWMERRSTTSAPAPGVLSCLLHGLVGSAKNWRRNISFLSRHSTVYAVDLFNMGESERVPGLDAGLEATADRVAACMDALGLDEADIAAHSHGGAVAMMFAARHPDRVRRLILFAPANPFCDLGNQLIRFYQTPFRHLVRPPDSLSAQDAEGHRAQPHVR